MAILPMVSVRPNCVSREAMRRSVFGLMPIAFATGVR